MSGGENTALAPDSPSARVHGWKRLLLVAAGFGGGFAVTIASIVGVWLWYENRPAKPKPWDTKAIVAVFDYPDTESSQTDGPSATRPDNIVLYYTLGNATDLDYTMPPLDQLELDARLKRQSSLSNGSDLMALDKEQMFIPAKQRMRFSVHLHFPVTENFGPDDTKEDHRKRWKLIADYMKNKFANLDGFVVFDRTNRYQINFPNGWDNIDLK